MKRIGLSILFVVFLITSLASAAERVRVAVAAEGKTAAAKVSVVAARAPCFLIFEGDEKLLEAVDNAHKGAKGGAGTSVVTFLAQKGVTFVVAGKFGEKMTQAMRSKGMGYLEFKGSAEAGLQKVLEGNKKGSE
jgi:predicted Fe-Mo cluster-binding NifX family protein